MIPSELIIHQLHALLLHISKVICCKTRERTCNAEVLAARNRTYAKRKLINENSFAIIHGLLINGFPLANSPSI